MFLLLYLSRRRHPTNMMPAGPREYWLWLAWLIVMAIWLGQPVVLYFVGDGRLISFTLLFVHPASLIAGAALALAGHLGTLWAYAAMGAS
ncbi:MAG: hypothetical protein QGD94_04525, partial [Planctomycetia bacterium]|nr:hypothetical protein [Planctomycetia bacterium]